MYVDYYIERKSNLRHSIPTKPSFLVTAVCHIVGRLSHYFHKPFSVYIMAMEDQDLSQPRQLFHHRMDKRWKMSTKPQITNFHSMAVVFRYQNATTFTGGKNIGVEKHSTCNKRSAWTQLCPYSTKRRGMELDFVEKYNDQNFLS